MISIITAVYNQIEMNKLFYDNLKKNSFYPFELIVIDNGSIDGSAEYFEKAGAKVIRNNGNYSYPFCQNQGIKIAQYEYFAFLNNDIIVAENWDKNAIEGMEYNGLEVATSCGIERCESRQKRKMLMLKWKFIKGILSLFSLKYESLKKMHELMYGNWAKFSRKRFEKYGYSIQEGFCGNSVFIKKSALQKIGLWDEKIQAADFDIYMRTKIRSVEKGDIRPCNILLGVFNHHYIRLTTRFSYPPFVDKNNIIPFEEKWDRELIDKYLKDSYEKH